MGNQFVRSIVLLAITACLTPAMRNLAGSNLGITVKDGLVYDSQINPSIRKFRLYYKTSAGITNPNLPIAVFIHGGGWITGGRGQDQITPITCGDTSTVACYLANAGYAVYSIDYTLVKAVAGGGDLVVDPANDRKVTSASRNFRPDTGNAIIVTNGNGWTKGGYTVESVSGDAAILNASPAPSGSIHGNYNDIEAGTIFPAQAQDCACFLSYLAERAGVSIPGNRNNITVMGHSAGGNLGLLVSLAPQGAFPRNCSHTSTSYKIQHVVVASASSDLISIYSIAVPTVKSLIRNYLGCIPGDGACNDTARAASPITYIAQRQPPVIVLSGFSDTSIPSSNAGELHRAYADLTPAVASTFIVYGMKGPAYYHDLDLFHYTPCSSDGTQGGEPSPCGTAGAAFQDIWKFLQK